MGNGITEVNQILTLNNLRHRVTLRTDGGLKTGRDIVIAAMMGAEEYGVATTSLVAMGCIMVRQCHSNTCPVGVCSQDKKLRDKFNGTPEKVVNLFTYVAKEVREILASIGYKSINEIIGRTDLLRQISKGSSNLDDLDLNPLVPKNVSLKNNTKQNHNLEKVIDFKILAEAKLAIEKRVKMSLSYKIQNTDRTVGAILSNEISKLYGANGLPNDTLKLNFKGAAGQSFGAFSTKGLTMKINGNTNDYFGKGLSGAKIIVKIPKESTIISHKNVITGNTALYGATSGEAYINGIAGERFCVRNSGATAVVEGVGDHGCEYMTGGIALILGDVGDNFGAGMTGGMAFIYDINNDFENKVNPETVIWQKPETNYWINFLKNNLDDFFKETKSKITKKILENFLEELKNFKQVCPIEMLDKLDNPITLKTIVKKVS